MAEVKWSDPRPPRPRNILIAVRDDGTKYGAHPLTYPVAVEHRIDDDGDEYVVEGSGIIRSANTMESVRAQGFRLREPKNADERKHVQRLRDALGTTDADWGLRRWAKRDGTTVEWGNVVGFMNGQSFRETFTTEAEAIERERQALACEGIGVDREPVAVERVDIRA